MANISKMGSLGVVNLNGPSKPVGPNDGMLTIPQFQNKQKQYTSGVSNYYNSMADNLPANTNYNYNPSISVGNIQPPKVGAIDYSGFNNLGTAATPELNLPDYSQFGNYADYTGRIQQAADMAVQQGLKQLQELTFQPEYDVERERLASRGLVGAGVENEALNQLLTSQQARATDFATNIQNAAFKEQTAELQNLRELQAEREKQQLQQEYDAAVTRGDWESAANIQRQQQKFDVVKTQVDNAFDASIAEGNWQNAAQIHNEQIRLDLEKVNMTNEQWKADHALDIERFKSDENYREWQSKHDEKLYLLERFKAETGMDVTQDELDLKEEELYYNEAYNLGYRGSDAEQYVADKMGGSSYKETGQAPNIGSDREWGSVKMATDDLARRGIKVPDFSIKTWTVESGDPKKDAIFSYKLPNGQKLYTKPSVSGRTWIG